MSAIEPSANQPQALTNEQKDALAKLHKTAQGMESLFINMMFTEMRKSAPQGGGLTGKESSAEETFGSMLDEQRAEKMAEGGGIGIGKILEQQLRSSVLGSVAPARGTPAIAPGGTPNPVNNAIKPIEGGSEQDSTK